MHRTEYCISTQIYTCSVRSRLIQCELLKMNIHDVHGHDCAYSVPQNLRASLPHFFTCLFCSPWCQALYGNNQGLQAWVYNVPAEEWYALLYYTMQVLAILFSSKKKHYFLYIVNKYNILRIPFWLCQYASGWFYCLSKSFRFHM